MKNLNTIYINENVIITLSYSTIIEIKTNFKHYVNNQKYSSTTTRAQNKIIKYFYTEEVNEFEINEIFKNEVINSINNSDNKHFNIKYLKNLSVYNILINGVNIFENENLEKFILNKKLNEKLAIKEVKTKVSKI